MLTSLFNPASATLRVLIVDDHHDGADSLAQLLQMYGMEAITVYSPTQAGQMIAEGLKPTVIIIEVGIGGGNGYTLARDICAALVRRPLLIALTSFPHLNERSQREGFDHHFVKPVNPSLLVGILQAENTTRANVPMVPLSAGSMSVGSADLGLTT